MTKETKLFRVVIGFKFEARSPEDDEVTILGIRKLSANTIEEAFDKVKLDLDECYSNRGIFIEGGISLKEVKEV